MHVAIIIPILRKSIRWNKNKGEADLVPTIQNIEVTGTKLSRADFKNIEQNKPILDTDQISLMVVSHSAKITAGKKTSFKFQAVGRTQNITDKTITAVRKRFGIKEYSINQHYEVIRSMFDPTFLYKYKKLKFKCPHCGQKDLTINQLESSEYIDDDGDDHYLNNLCPNCMTEINIQHEQMSDEQLSHYANSNADKKRKR